MLINLRNALMAGKRLPFDAEVEYLESTGTQWIDTGVVPTNNHGFLVRFRVPKIATNNNSRIIGVQDSTTRWLLSVNTNGLNTFFGWNEAISNLGAYYGQDVVATLNFNNSRSAVIKGTTVKSSLAALGNITDRAALFANIRDGSVISGEMLIGRLYAVKISNSNSLVRDFIPVRVGTVGYMYDRVSGKLFGNAGTGDFVLGPDVVPVEYIESHGTEYIDTEIKLRSTDTIDTRLYINSSNTASWYGILGSRDSARYLIFRCYANDDRLVNTLSPNHNFSFTRFTWGNLSFAFGGDYHESATNCYLFTYNNNGTPYYRLPYRFANFSITRDGSKLINLLPVRVGTEGAMMDVLTRRIYRNAGTGAFTYGNDLKYPIPA